MTAILTTAIATGGTVLGAVVAATAGYLGARSGAKEGLESGRADRMWGNRVSVYEELAEWVRVRREVNDRRCPACLRGETVQLEPRVVQVAQEGFPRDWTVGDLGFTRKSENCTTTSRGGMTGLT